MRKLVSVAGLATMLLLGVSGAFAAAPSASKPGTIVIVFKDGHRQTFNLADVARVEFPAADQLGSIDAQGPSRAHFIGKWKVGDGNGSNFYITLSEDGDAFRSLGDVHGKWAYVNGEAQATWDDGAKDAIRKAGNHFQKFAYHAEKSFTDTPDNVTEAHNLTPKAI